MMGAFFSTGCPKNVPMTEIPTLKGLDDIMWAQKGIAGPAFGKAKQDAFSNEEWAMLADVGARINATSTRVKNEFSQGRKEGFAGSAEALAQKASELETAAKGKDVVGAKAALSAMGAECKNCHSNFR